MMSKQKIEIEAGKIKLPNFTSSAILSNDVRKRFVFNENGNSYIAKNVENKIGCCLKIDSGLYTLADGEKCDFGLLLEDSRFFLIELKGKNIHKAYPQLYKTYGKLFKDYSNYCFKFYGRIICSAGKKSVVPQISTLQQNIKKYFVSVVIHERKFEEKV